MFILMFELCHDFPCKGLYKMALVLIIRNVQDLTETIPESGILLEKAPTSSGPFLDHCAANFFLRF